MKAATHDKYGSPQVLTLEEISPPAPGPGDVLVEVRASPVTQGDRRLRAADYPGGTWLMGRLFSGLFKPRHRTPGTVFAGKVVAVGERVTRFSVGDDVFGSCPHGAQAQYLAVDAEGPIAAMPSNIGYEEAAAVPYGAVTALTFMRDRGQVSAGQKVLVLGASGGVGRFAVQLARHYGAEVTGVCSRDFEVVRRLGAHDVIDYTVEDFADNGERYDVIFDTFGVSSFARCKPSLTPAGRYMSLHVSARLLLDMLMTSFTSGPKAIFGVSFGERESMEEVGALVGQGAITPVVESRYPLERVVEAHARAEARRPVGSVVVTMGPTEAMA